MIQDPALFDFTYLESMVGEDPDLCAELLAILAVQLPAEHKELQQAFASGQRDEIFEVSHRMKSTLSYTGNDLAIGLVRHIEESARLNQDLSDLSEKWQKLDEVLQRMEAALSATH